MIDNSGLLTDNALLTEASAMVAGRLDQAPVEFTGPGGVEQASDAVRIEGAAAADSSRNIERASTMAWLFQPCEDAREIDLFNLAELVADDKNFVWVDLSEYAAPDLQSLAQQLDLPRIAVHTALSVWQRPRLEVFDDQFFVAVTIPYREATSYRIQARELDLFVGSNVLVSVHKKPLPFGDRVLARARQRPELASLDSAFMLYIVLDELLAYGEGLSEGLENEIEQMEERALKETSDAFLDDLLRIKRFSFAVDRLIGHHEELFAAFLRPDFTFVSGDEVEPYFRDLDARLARLLDKIQDTREAVNGAFDIYVSHVSHRTNQVMKILTMVSTILLPSTIVLGIFGTNFKNIPIYESFDFAVMIGLIVLISATILLAFHRKGWF